MAEAAGSIPQHEGLNMSQTDSQNSPSIATRRRFLSQAAGAAASSTVLALAAIPPAPAAAAPAGALDPVFGLIEAHKRTTAALDIATAEVMRADELNEPRDDDLMDGPTGDENAALAKLLEAAPTTLAGIIAWVVYLNEAAKRDPWRVDENFVFPLLSGLATAFENGAVAS
jgi:hypothetical protein